MVVEGVAAFDSSPAPPEQAERTSTPPVTTTKGARNRLRRTSLEILLPGSISGLFRVHKEIVELSR